MKKQKIERFLSHVSLQLPSLMSKDNYTGADLFEDMAVLEFKLPKPIPMDELFDELDDQMELILLYHVIPSEATVTGHQCCAYSNPAFDYIYKVNGISNDDCACESIYVSLYESLETLGLDVLQELRDQTATTKVLFARKEEDVLRDFMK